MEPDRICPNCAGRVEATHIFCRQCGFINLEDELEADILLQARFPVIETKSTSCFHVLIVLFIIAILAAIAVPSKPRVRPLAREKACYANMRVILGAIEMYNLDNPVMEKSINPAVMEKLVNGNYLKSVPKCP